MQLLVRFYIIGRRQDEIPHGSILDSLLENCSKVTWRAILTLYPSIALIQNLRCRQNL